MKSPLYIMWEHETNLSAHKISYLMVLDFLEHLFIRANFNWIAYTQDQPMQIGLVNRKWNTMWEKRNARAKKIDWKKERDKWLRKRHRSDVHGPAMNKFYT